MKSRSYPRPRLALALLCLLLSAALFAGWRERANDPHPPTPASLARLRARMPQGMTLVPGGTCLLGTNDEDAEDDLKPERRVFVPSYYIDTHEVTNAEYRRFDPAHRFAPNQDRLPVTGVTYDQAAAYARWAGKRLPTEDEWERAARGDDGRRYPWGNTWDPSRVAERAHRKSNGASQQLDLVGGRTVSCNVGQARTQAVGSVPDGISPYGCYDMAGNAWEWVEGYYNGNPDQRILRGGAVGYGERACRTYERAIEGAGAT